MQKPNIRAIGSTGPVGAVNSYLIHQVEFMAQTNQRLLAIGLTCSAVFLFSLLDTTAKYLGEVAGLPFMQVVWMRFAGHFLFALIFFGPKVVTSLGQAGRPVFQLLRSLFVALATVFNFVAVTYLQLDQTISIFFISPLIVAALAGPLLGEWVGWRRFIAISVGFSGVILITRPGFGGIHWAISFSFCAAFSYALYLLLTRFLAEREPTDVTNFYTPIAGVIFPLPVALYVWVWPEDLTTWLFVSLLGLTGGVGHALLLYAHKFAPAPVTAPFIYSAIIYVSILGYLVFGDIPTYWTLGGGLVIIASGLYLLYRERY